MAIRFGVAKKIVNLDPFSPSISLEHLWSSSEYEDLCPVPYKKWIHWHELVLRIWFCAANQVAVITSSNFPLHEISLLRLMGALYLGNNHVLKDGIAYLLALESANNMTVSPTEIMEYDLLIENEYLGPKNIILDQSAIFEQRLFNSYGLQGLWINGDRIATTCNVDTYIIISNGVWAL
ncbi:hypothetical protein L1987_24655 [Smallanthus sonchifolius]|uniref:Uncharacterized protein n=1 Tax=Smallanthus sonchifolius TaxID=185202 RepID=A0ACB9ILM2_9ASTR|nr:hypothetical protein L1987_24655 [Smallanthus sonchifolius]